MVSKSATINSLQCQSRQLMHWDTLKQDNHSTVRGVGEVGSARYELALLPPCPSIRALSYSNCQEIHSSQQTGLAVLSVKPVKGVLRILKSVICQLVSLHK